VKLVLLVEDSGFMRMANERTLLRAGYGVVTARDGEEALRIAWARLPDLIVLDMLLPKLGGPEVLHALKNNPKTNFIPVIILSSLPQKNELTLRKEGAAAYFEKSKLELDNNSESFLHIVKRILDGVTEPEKRESPTRSSPTS
jgi:CheY-like chemotaxis protein